MGDVEQGYKRLDSGASGRSHSLVRMTRGKRASVDRIKYEENEPTGADRTSKQEKATPTCVPAYARTEYLTHVLSTLPTYRSGVLRSPVFPSGPWRQVRSPSQQLAMEGYIRNGFLRKAPRAAESTPGEART